VWSPEGTKLAFYAIAATGDQDLFVVPSGSGETTRLLERPRAQYPSSWSPDGRFLLFEELEAATMRRDVWVLPAGEAPKPVIVTGFYERGAVFSPDGGQIAYVSDESGRPEVYVQPFPGPGPKVTVSLNGGLQPVWSRDGKELFYREDDWLVAAEVQPSPFRVLSAQRLVELPADLYNLDVNFADYDVAADGRFIAVRRENPSGDAIHVVLNWTTELAKALGR
jgi:Tol biopolymer transport system component